MTKLSGPFCVLIYILNYAFCEEHSHMQLVSSADPFQPEFDFNYDIESLISKCQNIATQADRSARAGIIPQEEVEKQYDKVLEILEDIIDAVHHPNRAFQFINMKGFDRIVLNNLITDYDELKVRLLTLLKVLFHVAPTSTRTNIPLAIVDRLLDIFENDSLALKAHSLDVLYVWIPGNPRVQARVMKVKGLVPFYEQLTYLDTNVIKKLLDLFNKVLEEHVHARSEKQDHLNSDMRLFYQRIGLLEHLSTPAVCNGLLDVFMQSWSYNTNDNNILMTVFDLMKNVKDYCISSFRGKAKAVKLFTALEEFVQGPQNENNFVTNGVNVTDVSLVIADYLKQLRLTARDEF